MHGDEGDGEEVHGRDGDEVNDGERGKNEVKEVPSNGSDSENEGGRKMRERKVRKVPQ